MKTKNIDLINIGLILVSLFVAFKLPFELFLFSYAVLGPLHYLTEINWLKEKNYFIPERKWIWVFVAFGLIMSIPVVMQLPVLSSFAEQEAVKAVLKAISDKFTEILLFALLFSIGLVYLRKWQHILLFLVGSIVLSLLILKYIPLSLVLIGVFLPTIIHVYFFTLFFMMFGTLNTKSGAGIVAIILLLLAPLIIYMSHINPNHYNISESTKTTFLASNFHVISSTMAEKMGALTNGTFFLMSKAGIKIQIFISFCYTYHYLNWFSKTSIIGWHKNVSKPKLAILLLSWLAAVGLYWYDYKLGFIALFFLSMLHVFLEFPLNVTSIKGIISKMGPGKKTLSKGKG